MARIDDQMEAPEDSAVRALGSANNSLYTDVIERLHHGKGTAVQQLEAMQSMLHLRSSWGVRGLRNATINHKIDREGRGYYNLHYSPDRSKYRNDPIDITLFYEEIGDECTVYINGRKAFSFARSNPAEITLASNCRAEEATELLLDFKAGLSQALHEHDGELEEIETSFDASQKERIAVAFVQLYDAYRHISSSQTRRTMRETQDDITEFLALALSGVETLRAMEVKINPKALSRFKEACDITKSFLETERFIPSDVESGEDEIEIKTWLRRMLMSFFRISASPTNSAPRKSIEEQEGEFNRLKEENLSRIPELRKLLEELEDPSLGELLSNDPFVSSVVRILEASRPTR